MKLTFDYGVIFIINKNISVYLESKLFKILKNSFHSLIKSDGIAARLISETANIDVLRNRCS